jgi:2-polyprenyl-6-methoxyphenol hydroxylase-like FAD-dependent oxidoreductase
MASSLPSRPTGGEQLDVLVVGAGPTGLTLAAQLRALGARTRIVDRQHGRVHESRALAIQPRTLEVLRGLGVAQTLVDRGNHAAGLQVHTGSHAVALRLFDIGVDDTAYPFLLFLSQAETEAVLGEHLASHGVAVERGVELTGVHADQDDQELACTLRHDRGGAERVRTRYLVGCDGATAPSATSPGSPSKAARTHAPSRSPTSRSTAAWSPAASTCSPGRPGCCFSSRSAGWRPGA